MQTIRNVEVALGDGSGENWQAWDDGLAEERGDDDWWGMFGCDFGDFNNDGLLDIASASFGSGTGLHVYSNNGDGSWEDVLYQWGLGNSLYETYFGDINNDGNLDLACNIDDWEVLFGDGEGNWEDGHHNLPAPFADLPYFSVDLGDVDGDGGDDFAFINADFGLDVFSFNVENGEWVSLSDNLPEGGNYQQLDLYDMDMDNDLDIVASTGVGLEVWLQNPDEDEQWELAFEWQPDDEIRRPRALRVGGDVDHNGLSEIILFAEYGDGNRLNFFAETTVAEELWINSVDPQGGERFRAGSVRFIDWAAAIPDRLDPDDAVVNLYFSVSGPEGAWVEIVEGYSNGGRYQWTVPQRVSDDCLIKYELVFGDEIVETITPTPFIIFGAIDPVLSVSPESLHFIIPVGDAEERELIIHNAGGGTLDVEPLVLGESVVFSHDAGEEGFQLQSNEERVVNVTFAPEEEGEFEDVLNVTSDGGEFQVALTSRTGVPEPPLLVVSPDSVDFGRKLVEDIAARRITFRNEGEMAADYSIDAPDEGVFNWEAVENGIINPRGEASIIVEFQPFAAGEFVSEIVLRYQEGELNIPLLGVGVLSLLVEFSDDTLDFGRIEINNSTSMDITISNISDDEISIYVAEPTTNIYTWQTRGWQDVRSGNRLVIPVEFNPRTPGLEIDEMEISVSGESTYNIILSGEGYDREYVEDQDVKPLSFGIHSVSPNPFNESLNITYAIDSPGKAEISIHNLSGRQVGIVDVTTVSPGVSTLSINTADLVSGTYLIKLQQENSLNVVKVVHLK
ncbi:MAG: T9SS type A sorting domain-containing protein [Calditrichaeota bacterium]|nr:T9SS type A sorting domain-containing protein [Calditrichota bacterium]